MTKIRFELSPKPPKAEKAAKGKSRFYKPGHVSLRKYNYLKMPDRNRLAIFPNITQRDFLPSQKNARFERAD